MRHLIWIALIASTVPAQTSDNAADLLRKLRSVSAATKSWRAEVLEEGEIEYGGTTRRDRVHVSIAAEAPLKMRRQNSGDDRTMMACDGRESFYSTDGRTWSRGEASVNPACNHTLSWFYNLEPNPASVTIVGRHRVRLDNGERPCTLLRLESRRDDVHSVRTLCVDDEWTVALRDVVEAENQKVGRLRKTTTFTSFESNPRWSRDEFRFSPPPAVAPK